MRFVVITTSNLPNGSLGAQNRCPRYPEVIGYDDEPRDRIHSRLKARRDMFVQRRDGPFCRILTVTSVTVLVTAKDAFACRLCDMLPREA